MVSKFFIFIKTRFEVSDYYLVLNGNHEHILKRLSTGEKNDFPKEAQLALVERGNHDEIVSMLQNKSLCIEVREKVLEKIVERGNALELTIVCQKTTGIGKDLADKIIDFGYAKPISIMLEKRPISLFCSDIQEKIINLGNPELTKLLTQYIHLSDSNIVKLIEAGYSGVSTIIPYGTYVYGTYVYSDKVFEAVVKNCSVADVEYVAGKFNLPEDVAMLLLERYADNVDIMDAFLESKIYFSKVQLEIIKKLSHEYVMKLILNNKLSGEACLAIIQNGNMEEINKLITSQDYLSQEVINALLARNVHSEMVNLMKNQLISNSVLEELVKRCRFDYIRLYLSFHEADPQFTQLLLLEVLERTVK